VFSGWLRLTPVRGGWLCPIRAQVSAVSFGLARRVFAAILGTRPGSAIASIPAIGPVTWAPSPVSREGGQVRGPTEPKAG
jgi:hypothetical protein